MSEYYQLLKDPRWQKKRLEIFERSNWCCDECAEETKTLNAHHCYYDFGKMPWEYPDDAYSSLCDKCHKITHEINKQIKEALKPLDITDRSRVLGYIIGQRFGFAGSEEFQAADGDIIIGLSDCESVDPVELIECMQANSNTISYKTLCELKRGAASGE